MSKHRSITISFKPDSIDLYEFLKSKDNMSAYILRLIRNDMVHNNNSSLKQEIKDILLEVLDESDISINSESNNSNITLNENDIDIINDFF